MKQLNVALVGHGKMGGFLAQNLSVHAGFHISHIIDQNPDIASQITNKPYSAAKVETNIDVALNDPGVDVVVIATLPESHFGLAKAALEAGKHVLIEKPMTENAEQAKELVALAKRKGLKLMVDHTLLYEEAAQTLASEIASKRYGTPKTFEFKRTQPLSDRFANRNCFDELAPHVLSVLDLFDQHQSSQMVVQYLDGDLKHGVDAHITTQSGIDGRIHFEFSPDLDAANQARSTTIRFNPKRMSQTQEVTHLAEWNEARDVSGEQNIVISDDAGNAVRTIKAGKELPLAAVADDLYESITQDRTPKSDGISGLRVMQMMDAVKRSKERGGEPVTIDLEPMALKTSMLRAVK